MLLYSQGYPENASIASDFSSFIYSKTGIAKPITHSTHPRLIGFATGAAAPVYGTTAVVDVPFSTANVVEVALTTEYGVPDSVPLNGPTSVVPLMNGAVVVVMTTAELVDVTIAELVDVERLFR